MAEQSIDTLQIEINASAKSSKAEINELCKSLTKLRGELSAVSKVGSLGFTGIKGLGTAAKGAVVGIKNLDTAIKGTKKSTHGLLSTMGKLYASFWALKKAFGWIGDSVKYASQLTEVQNVVRNAFGPESEKMVNDFAGSMAMLKFGMNELTTKEIASRFQSMGKTLGITNAQMKETQKTVNGLPETYDNAADSVADMSLNLTKLAADMGSFYNKEASEVAQSLSAIYTGQTRPLRQYGLDLTQATLQEWALKNGLDADMKSMTQAEKTLLRYQYVMSNAKLSMGDFEATANTFANVVKTLKQQFQALGGIVGGVFVSAFKPALIALRGFMQNVLDFAKTVADALGAIFGWTIEITASGSGGSGVDDAFSDVADDLGNASDSAGGLSDGLGSAGKNAKDLADKLSVLPFDELNQLAKDTASSGSGSGSGGSGSGGSGGGSGGSGSMSGSGASATLVRTEAVMDNIKSDIDSLGELGAYISQALTEALEGIPWNDIYKVADKFGSGLAEFLNGLITPDLFSALGGTIAGAINTALHAENAFAGKFDWENLGKSIASGINRFFKDWDAKLAASTFNKFANGILTTMITAIGGVEWDKIGRKIGDALVDVDLEGIAEKLGTLINTKLKAVADFVGELKLDKLGTKIGKSINSFFTGLKLEEVGADIAKVANAILDFVSNAVSEIKFKDIGEDIAKGISKIFTDFSFAKLGATVSGLATGLLDFVNSALDNIKWLDIGKAIVDFIANISWADVIAKAVTAISKIAGALVLVISGAVMEIGEKAEITKVGSEVVETICGAITKALGTVGELPQIALDLIDGIFKGFSDNAIGWATRINEKIVKPFIDGIKSLFGIHSPSTVMAEIGGFLMDGLFNGVTAGIEAIKTAFSNLVADIKGFFKDPIGTIQIKGGEILDSLGKVGSSIANSEIGITVKAAGDALFNKIFGSDGTGGTITNYVEKGLSVTKSALGKIGDGFSEWFGEKGEGGIFAKFTQKGATAVKSAVGKIGDGFKDWFGEKGEGGYFSNFTQKGATAIKYAAGKIGGGFKDWFGEKGEGGIFTSFTKNGITATKYAEAKKDAKGTFKYIFGGDGTGGIFGKYTKNGRKAKKWAVGAKDGKKGTFATWFGGDGTGGIFGKYTTSGRSATKYAHGSKTDGFKSVFGGDGTGGAYGKAKDRTVTLKVKASYSDDTAKHAAEYLGKHNAEGGLFSGGSWHPIQTYARGGFPDTSQLFIAREAGPELVGTLKGHTAVMNNNQIVASVSDGVARAISNIQFHMQGYQAPEIDARVLADAVEYGVASAMANNANQRPIDVYATIKTQNDEVLARAVARGNQRLNYRVSAVGV